MNRLACIVPHFGRQRVTLDCLSSLVRTRPFPRIIVVCNTEPGQAALLAEEAANELSGISVAIHVPGAQPSRTDILVACTGGNRGFARACNMGLELAKTMPEVRHAWLLNNDTEVEPGAALALLACLETSGRSVLGTSVVRHQTPERLELALGCSFSPWTTRITPNLPGALLREIPAEFSPSIDYVYGASFAFPMALPEAIGPLNEAFFLYYEEHDFCLRARRAGYSLRWCREAVVRHRHGQASGLHETSANEARKLSHYHETFSTFLFLRLHHPWALPCAVLVRTAAKLALLPLRGEGWLLPSYFRALADFFRRA